MTILKSLGITILLVILILFLPVLLVIVGIALIFGIVYLSLKDLEEKRKPPT